MPERLSRSLAAIGKWLEWRGGYLSLTRMTATGRIALHID